MAIRSFPAAILLASLCCPQVAAPAWGQPNPPSRRSKSSSDRKLSKKKRIWTGLALIAAGAVTFATAGRTRNIPEQCALVPLVGFCVPAHTVKTHSEAQQGIGAGLVAAGGVILWSGLP